MTCPENPRGFFPNQAPDQRVSGPRIPRDHYQVVQDQNWRGQFPKQQHRLDIQDKDVLARFTVDS